MKDKFFISTIHKAPFDFYLLFAIKETTLKKMLKQSGDVVEFQNKRGKPLCVYYHKIS